MKVSSNIEKEHYKMLILWNQESLQGGFEKQELKEKKAFGVEKHEQRSEVHG